MKIGSSLATVGWFLLTASAAWSQTTSTITPAFPSGTGWTFYSAGGLTGSNGVVSGLTPPYGASFTTGYGVDVIHADSRDDVRYYTTTGSVTAGDALIATVYYQRTDGIAMGLPNANNKYIYPNESNIYAVFSQTSGTTTLASLVAPLRGRNQWRSVNIPFIAASTGTGEFQVDFASAIQNVVVAGVQVVDYGQRSVISRTNPVDDTSGFVFKTVGTDATETSTPTTGQIFSSFDKITVSSTTGTLANANLIGLTGTITGTITSGDTLVVAAWMKRDNSSNQTQMALAGYNIVAASGATGTLTALRSLVVDNNWKQYYLATTATATFAPNTAVLQVYCGIDPEVIDIAGLQILDLGTTVSTASLTSNQLDYPGRILGGTWLTAAQSRIQQYRTGTLTVNVLNSSGAALDNVPVSGHMTKHEFKFGGWAHGYEFTGTVSPQIANPIVQGIVSQYKNNGPNTNAFFSCFTDGFYKWNDYWGQSVTADSWGYTENNYLRTNGIFNIRGHNVTYPYFYINNYLPSTLSSETGATLSTAILAHIDQLTGDMTNAAPNQQVCGLVTEWDSVNEPYSARRDSFFTGIAGLGTGTATPYIAATNSTGWHTEIGKNDPSPPLFINEQGPEENYYRSASPQSYLTSSEEYNYEMMTNMINEGATVDGFNFESHFQPANNPFYGTNVTDPYTEAEIFGRFSALVSTTGTLSGEVTEYDPEFTDQSLQGDYMSDYLTLAYSEPNFTGFTLYGFWAGGGSYPNSFPTAAMTMLPGTPAGQTNYYGNIFNTDWSVSPSGEAYLGLVKGQWWTYSATGTTSSTGGAAALSGYLGRYEVTASGGSVTKNYYVDLPTNAGSNLNLQLGGTNTLTTNNVWVYDAAASKEVYLPMVAENGVSGAVNHAAVEVSTAGAFIPPGEGTGPQQLRIDTEATGTVTIWLRGMASSGHSEISQGIVTGGTNTWTTTDINLYKGTSFGWTKAGTATLTPNCAHAVYYNSVETGGLIDQVLITDDPTFTPTY
jgi:hypothetical protein